MSRHAFLDSHPSISASMEDFEAREFSPTVPDLPSQHSGFRSNTSSYSDGGSSSRRSYSPPAWRKAGSGWFKHQQSYSPSRSAFHSKEPSPAFRSCEDDGRDDGEGEVTAFPIPSRIPLPESPVKGRSPSASPEPEFGGDRDKGGGELKRERDATPDVSDEVPSAETTPTQNNYIRFSTSLDVVQHTEPIEAAIQHLRKGYHHVFKTPYTAFFYSLLTLLLFQIYTSLLTTPVNAPAPDLVKVASLAKSFEPVIYYSEHGHAQISELQDTGIAVWDLGESVRSTNMTSAPIIVHQLDDLSDSLKTLAVELTRFFAGVDADVDSILLVMEWAGRELHSLSSTPSSTLASIWSNTHNLLIRTGLFGSGEVMRGLLGQTRAERTKSTLERTFQEFLNVLEESINNELDYSIQLFALFEAIDKQFLNLQRSVIREQDTQERLENDFLSSLWTKVIGANSGKLRKYERNRNLLLSVRDRTVRNKHVLVDHNQRLLQLKSNLEILRRKLVSPLVRSQNSSTLGVEEQIRGLEGTYELLRGSREGQKRKMMELVYGSGNRRAAAAAGLEGMGRREIEGM
ncbi:hypothetical protein MBLNU230_g5762t1 [Neophaeotheca triangularis]